MEGSWLQRGRPLWQLLDEASFRTALPAIEGEHMATPIQIHSRATWIGMIQGLEGEIHRIGIVLWGMKYPGPTSTSSHIWRAYLFGF